MPLFSRHSLLLQTGFSELKRRAVEQPFLLAGTPGSVGERNVNDRRFYYRQFYDAQGKKSAEYIGPVGDPESEARASAVRDEIELANTLVREARVLGQQGYVRLGGRAGAILASLANRGLFRAGAVLVGSHAYGALLNELGVKGAVFFTEDVDIARGRPLEVALAPTETFAQILAAPTVPLHPVPGMNRKAPSTSYKTPGGDRLRVDLLVPAEGSEVTIRAVPELKAYATALPYLAYLLSDPADAVVLGRESVVPVRVPRPETFAWHKMLVSQLRGETREKRGKDTSQAAVMVAVLAEDSPDALKDAFDALPRGSKGKTRAGAKAVLAVLEREGHGKAVEELASAIA
jgi:hypothetical protein